MAHRRKLLNYANGIMGDRARAEDVVQEAWLRFDAAVVAQSPDEPVGYLYRIVRNLALDGCRRQAREERHLVSGTEAGIEDMAEDRPSPEAETLARDDMRVMLAAMAELPERTRRALEMHRFTGCKLKDIADNLGISVGAAHALVIDGLEHCRARLHRPS
ncbi:RNA polymerase subunit sigma-24 [Telmatospirillum siberiense]|uniref:RNA polymerase subunit sigma-24 n=2 Tax=Telmatospirillum siberiense TaxID=382514 RepID=A0A2N3Q0T5_9PROT|nr:RNA polymerase subunit sigma-24 [Telmatospirillum siberiense]